jgi:hypothetical protein
LSGRLCLPLFGFFAILKKTGRRSLPDKTA